MDTTTSSRVGDERLVEVIELEETTQDHSLQGQGTQSDTNTRKWKVIPKSRSVFWDEFEVLWVGEGDDKTKTGKCRRFPKMFGLLMINNLKKIRQRLLSISRRGYLRCLRWSLIDVLQWWRLKSPGFPVLSALAKDILAIPISSVALECAFSTGGRGNGGRVLSPFRSSLTRNIVEALICVQDWLRSSTCTYLSDVEDVPEEVLDAEFVEVLHQTGFLPPPPLPTPPSPT